MYRCLGHAVLRAGRTVATPVCLFRSNLPVLHVPLHSQLLIKSSNPTRTTPARVWGQLYYSTIEDPDNVKIPIPEIPKDKLDIKFVKSSAGPGGQNVNKLNTKAEVRFKPKSADWIPNVMLERFLELNKHRINNDGEMVITSAKHRFQARNLQDCLDKLREYLEEASIIPKERIATVMPEYAKEKRLDDKKKRSDVKKNRQRPDW